MTTEIIKRKECWTRYIPVENAGDNNFVKVQAYYDLGGINYFNGKTEPRGYYLAVAPVGRSVSADGVVCERHTLFDGAKVLLEETARFNKKKADQIFSVALNDPVIKQWMDNNGYVEKVTE